MFCDNCGQKIAEESIFCDKCGQTVALSRTVPYLNEDPYLIKTESQFNTNKEKNNIHKKDSGLKLHALYAGILLMIVLASGYYFNTSLTNQQQKVEQIARSANASVEMSNKKLAQAQSELSASKSKIKESNFVSAPSVSPTKLTNSQIINKVRPAVVYIETSVGKGSGMIISPDGYILTNAHVVKGVSSATVILSTGVSYEAVIKGKNESLDVVVLKISATGLPTVTLGNSDDVGPGDNVFALGFPFGLKGDVSFTAGVISRRLAGSGYSYFESTAEIHPGNSGGPLVSMNGQVIGINTASYTPVVINNIQLGESIKFAIPINLAKSQISELKNSSSVFIPPVTYPQPVYSPPPPDNKAIGENHYIVHRTCIGLTGEQYEFCLSYAYNH